MSSIKILTQRIRQHWQIFLQAGIWIMTVLGGFILPPPLWDFKEDAVWFRFSHFLVSALIGLLFIPMKSWADKKHQWVWWWITVLTLVAGILIFFEYQSLRAQWTRSYAGARIVAGQTYTEDALKYKQTVYNRDQREVSDDELIMDSGGKTESIWQADEIRHRRLILAGVYVGILSLFAITMITLVQALYCNTKNVKSVEKASLPDHVGEQT